MTTSPQAPAPDPFAAMAAQLTPKRAVSYIRVSTREQAERGGAEEGFSIPAQREANKKKAASMGALVVKEFVDRGESARSANRPELQRMLRYLKDAGDVDYVIVHKLDRLARNRADDVETNRAFDKAGVRLVSTSENIDQTPGGILLHGIMSSIAEFYSRNLANEVIKGMSEKARNGGTNGKAPLGYRNVRARDAQGHEIRTVELDPERAPLMRLAFTEYATGNWTVCALAEHLTGLGLTTSPTPNKPAKAVSTGRLQNLLRHPYYKGVVTFQGVEYSGRHEPLVDAATWQKVQDILDSHRNGERERVHNHHLKTTIVCGLCGERLLVQNTKNSKGVVYPYFICARRHRTHNCSFRAVLIETVEERVADLYKTIQLSHTDRRAVERYLLAELERIEKNSDRDIRSLTARRTNLENQRRRLLQAHYAGAVPLELLKEEQNLMSRELAAIQHELDGYKADAWLVRAHLSQALDLLEDCHRMYTAAPDHLKKQLNRVFFERVLVNPDTDEKGRLVLPPTDPGSDSTADAPKNSNNPSAGPGDNSGADESRAANIPNSEDGLPGASPSPVPVLVHDRAGRTRAAASLNPPFDQLTNHELQRTAQQNQPRRGSSGAKPASTQRKAPAQQGRRSQSSNTNPDHSPHGPGSYKNLVVPRTGIEPATFGTGNQRSIQLS